MRLGHKRQQALREIPGEPVFFNVIEFISFAYVVTSKFYTKKNFR